MRRVRHTQRAPRQRRDRALRHVQRKRIAAVEILVAARRCHHDGAGLERAAASRLRDTAATRQGIACLRLTSLCTGPLRRRHLKRLRADDLHNAHALAPAAKASDTQTIGSENEPPMLRSPRRAPSSCGRHTPGHNACAHGTHVHLGRGGVRWRLAAPLRHCLVRRRHACRECWVVRALGRRRPGWVVARRNESSGFSGADSDNAGRTFAAHLQQPVTFLFREALERRAGCPDLGADIARSRHRRARRADLGVPGLRQLFPEPVGVVRARRVVERLQEKRA